MVNIAFNDSIDGCLDRKITGRKGKFICKLIIFSGEGITLTNNNISNVIDLL